MVIPFLQPYLNIINMTKKDLERNLMQIGTEVAIIIPVSKNGLYELVNDAVSNAVEKLVIQKPQPSKTKLKGFRNASKAIGVGVNTLMKLRDEERIRFYNVGGNFFFYKEELLEDLEKLGKGGKAV